jgi:hypothetical protein
MATKRHRHGPPVTHGQARNGGTRAYRSYTGMLNRVLNPNNEHYRRYRNVKITPRWLGKDGYAHFLQDMGPRPQNKTLGRLLDAADPGYCKENCEWQTRREQGTEQRARHAMDRFEAHYGVHRTVKL